MHNFQGAVKFIHNPDMFGTYPDFVNDLMYKIFNVDGSPKRKTRDLVKETIEESGISYWELFKTSLAGGWVYEFCKDRLAKLKTNISKKPISSLIQIFAMVVVLTNARPMYAQHYATPYLKIKFIFSTKIVSSAVLVCMLVTKERWAGTFLKVVMV